MTLQIVTQRLTWPSEYVNRLYHNIRRLTTLEFDFVCFTDAPEGLDPAIKVRPLPYKLKPGWENSYPFDSYPWSLGLLERMPMFKKGMFPKDDMIAFIDLDTVFTGKSLDPILSYKGDFAILRDFYRPDGLQFSFAMWRVDEHAYDIYDFWQDDGAPLDRSDQQRIEDTTYKPDIFQHMIPGQFVSWKANDCQGGIPKEASVVIFHGVPKPHDIVDGPLPAMWKGEE